MKKENPVAAAPKKEDVRVVKTKRDLRNALIALLQTVPLDKITVCDICEKAIVNRMTFYKHYSDKYELLEDVFCYAEGVLVEELRRFWNQCKEDDPMAFFERIVKAIIERLLDEGEALGVIARQKNPVIVSLIFRAVHLSITEMLSLYGELKVCKHDEEEIAKYLAGGLGMSIATYLSSGSHRSREEFIELNQKIFVDFLTSGTFFA